MRLLIFLAIVALFCVPNASYCQGKYDRQADCKLQCQDAYDMAVTNCKTAWDGPYDTKQRQKCIDKARARYESCVKKCEGLHDAE
jgi:hypothetical protein